MRLTVLFQTIVGLCLFALLVGCGTSEQSSYKTHYTYQPPAAERGKTCVASCQQELRHCEASHNSVNQTCLEQQHTAAMQQFEMYKQTQIAQGDQVKDTWRSYYHPEMCRKTDKSCVRDYRVCYQLCGGKVAMHQVKRRSLV